MSDRQAGVGGAGWLNKPVFWGAAIVAMVLIGARLSISLVGGAQLISAGPALVFDAVVLALVLFVVLALIVRAITNMPLALLQARLRATTPDGIVVVSVIETDQFSFLRRHGGRIDFGPWPFPAGVVLSPNAIGIWRRAGSQIKEVANAQSVDIAFAVVSISTPVGTFPVLEVTDARGSLRLYPKDVSRWWLNRRLTAVQLREIVSEISSAP